ncbi:TlpA disulfide reductase family protein [Rhodohalobacter sp. SW132]|uniref:TlpA family protein disulfide reductase n=1 Tax=Rhodohalobacter sp. SW132 TaxID=2293433 RepID=UPI001314D13D|nr:TlpA disulfide reductase family protein [Rhodohalobacter sp. SW132]
MKKTITLIKKTFIVVSIIWTTITLVFIGFMALSGPPSCGIDDLDNETLSETTGDLPDFGFEEMDGNTTFTNESIAGTYTLFYFWGTSCGICVNEMPHLYETYTELQDRNFQIIALSYDQSEEKVREFREDSPMPWKHIVFGSDREKMRDTFNAFGVSGSPHKILVSPEGEILERVEGFNGDELYAMINNHLPSS